MCMLAIKQKSKVSNILKFLKYIDMSRSNANAILYKIKEQKYPADESTWYSLHKIKSIHHHWEDKAVLNILILPG